MNKPYFCRIFFLTDWRHKRLKNKIDLLLFYRGHFYGFLQSDSDKFLLKFPIWTVVLYDMCTPA